MKKIRLALMAFAVIGFTALYSCDGGTTEKEVQEQADSLINAMNEAVDQAIDNAEETIVEDTTATEEVVTDSTATSEEETTEEEVE